MIPSNPICPVCNYATNPTYCQLPSPEQLACGVVPLDSLPAAWWNAMWHETNAAVNQARGAVGALITEVNNVLQGAGVCVNPSCTDQLYQAIDKIRQTIGNASIAGAVKSSSCPGEVSIDANGIMTANCVGNAANLTTTARTLTGAVNELKSTYDCCFNSTDTAIGTKAPNMHASDQTTYGVGNASCYGHLKISDEYTCVVGCACDGVAASQKSVNDVYEFAAGIAAGVAALGNTAGCPLGNASAGTAVTAARSDHVHPVSKYLGICNTDIGYFVVCCCEMNYRLKIFGRANACTCVDCAVRAGSASSATIATCACWTRYTSSAPSGWALQAQAGITRLVCNGSVVSGTVVYIPLW